MRAGKLNQRVIVDRPQRGQDTSGDETITFVPVATVWAEIVPSTSGMRERMSANQLLASVDTIIRIRWAPIIADIEQTWRVSFGQIIYSIVGVANLNMANRTLELMCVSGENRG